MARRRKSSSSNKTKEERRVSAESAAQEREAEDKNSSEQGTNETLNRAINPNVAEEPNNEETGEQSKDKMMPLDIQQMILGDLQGVGHGKEIIVSRENVGDVMEEKMNEEVTESGTVVESPREEEYVIQTEEEDEDELIYMNEDDDDGEENQYVIVVNSDFEVNEDVDQEVVSIHNLADLQEGSCEIITVVRESDYDSSQESLDEMEDEGCNDINAVIGTVDGIHCVKISQYNSEDESSNHDDSLEKEIQIIEHDAEVACVSSTPDNDSSNVDNCQYKDIEMIKEDDELSCNDGQMKLTESEFVEHSEETLHETMGTCSKTEDSNVHDSSKIKSDENKIVEQESEIKMCIEKPEDSKDKEPNTTLSRRGKEVKNIDIEVATKLIKDNLNMSPKSALITKTTHDINLFSNSEKSDIMIQNDNIEEAKKSATNKISTSQQLKMEIHEQHTPDSSEGSNKVNAKDIKSISTKYKQLESPKIESTRNNLIISSQLLPDLRSEEKSRKVQEDEVTSNCNVNYNSENDIIRTTDLVSNSIKQEKELSLTFGNSLDEENSNNKEEKMDVSKEELVVKDEEGRQNVFRSRSGSTDTTGSESGSNSSFSRRRSVRIKSIGVSKQIESDVSYKSNLASLVTSTSTPPVPGYEPDKPVKVKSRWRRSSELEMGSGNKRQQEVDAIHVNRSADSTCARSSQPTTPPDSPPSDKEVEDVLSSFQHLSINEYHTER